MTYQSKKLIMAMNVAKTWAVDAVTICCVGQIIGFI
jgi:hypothetical protein